MILNDNVSVSAFKRVNFLKWFINWAINTNSINPRKMFRGNIVVNNGISKDTGSVIVFSTKEQHFLRQYQPNNTTMKNTKMSLYAFFCCFQTNGISMVIVTGLHNKAKLSYSMAALICFHPMTLILSIGRNLVVS